MALLVAGAALLTRDMSVYRNTWAADLANEAGVLALSTAPALAFDDHKVARRALATQRDRPEVLTAALYTAEGRLYASYAKSERDAAPAEVPPITGLTVSGELVELTRPVVRGGEVLGTLYMRARYDIASRVEDYLGIFAVVLLLGLTVAYVLSRRLQTAITAPLEAMATVSRAIVDRRDYSLRAKKVTDDEIGLVVDAFNGMLEEVQSADRRKDEFLATLAHELRNPLAPIRHAVRLLEAKTTDEERQQWAREVIVRQVQRMALLLDDLLDVSRITRGRLDLKIGTVTLESLIGTAVETARPLIDAKLQHLAVRLPEARIALRADPLRLSQSLSNLLTNAAKYTDPQGHIGLEVSLSAETIDLAVKDDGIGLDPKAIPALFEMFSQVESVIDRAEGGLGIGLALVKGLMTLHGGTVEARSAGLGKGSEFILHLPRSVVVDLADDDPVSAAAARAVSGTRNLILVADDNRDAAQSMAMVLEVGGYEVLVAHTGQEALRMTEELRPDAAILDIGMPDMTGYDVARRLRREPWGRGMVLLAITGWGQQEDKDRAQAAGFDRHFTKPVDPDEVEAALQALLSARHPG
jgi:signal transduction histidine kinase/ActR/RegA family two-component response regulator